MEIIVVIFFFALAVWYLYRRYKNMLNPNSTSCGCGGCDFGTGSAVDKRREHSHQSD